MLTEGLEAKRDNPEALIVACDNKSNYRECENDSQSEEEPERMWSLRGISRDQRSTQL